jgi:DNA-binding LacI/PurR family transcriptional regulator
MKEIAEAVGVSQSTVSRVLNGSPGNVPIAQDTRERIQLAVKELGYRPDPLARGLRGVGTALLGLIVREVADPFFASAIEVIAGEARRHGYNLVLGHAQSSGDEALALSSILETRHCDGIILLGDLKDTPKVWDDISDAAIPLVALCQGPRTPGLPTINTDNARGVTLSLEYLHKLGHSRIAFVDAGWLGDVGERRTAYLDWMSQHGKPMPDGYQQPGDNNPESGAEAFKRLMALPEPPSAVLCATDQVALGVLSAAGELSVVVPTDVSVIGFDDIPLARFTVPSLTTVRQPLQDMARLALEQLLTLVKREEAPPMVYRQICQPTLVKRGSCGVPKSSKQPE